MLYRSMKYFNSIYNSPAINSTPNTHWTGLSSILTEMWYFFIPFFPLCFPFFLSLSPHPSFPSFFPIPAHTTAINRMLITRKYYRKVVLCFLGTIHIQKCIAILHGRGLFGYSSRGLVSLPFWVCYYKYIQYIHVYKRGTK